VLDGHGLRSYELEDDLPQDCVSPRRIYLNAAITIFPTTVSADGPRRLRLFGAGGSVASRIIVGRTKKTITNLHFRPSADAPFGPAPSTPWGKKGPVYIG